MSGSMEAVSAVAVEVEDLDDSALLKAAAEAEAADAAEEEAPAEESAE